MVFSSLTFLYIFLPINLILYFSIKNEKWRNWILIILSLLFYAYGEPVWVILLIISAITDYFFGIVIEDNLSNKKSKYALIASITTNLGILGIFKYTGFIFENINFIFQSDLPYKEFMLPIGISFYTFQTLSYTVDVYRGEIKAQREFHKFLLFVSMYHQLIAGPVVRYKDIAAEIEKREITYDKFSYGVNRFIIGLGKKVLIANNAGSIGKVFLEQDVSTLSVAGAWLGISFFAIQIYFDFSGYSDMAIGLGRMFGFTYKENFNYPYIAKSATEFWRRWHISLSSFFRDYLYIPLGGNRSFQIRNLFIVWFFTGFWHGASWNFVVWGLFYGFFITIEKMFLNKILEKVPAFLSHIYLLSIMLIAWVFFYFEDLNYGINYIKTMIGLSGNTIIDTELMIHFQNNIYFLMLAILLSTPLFRNIYFRIKNRIVFSQILEGIFVILILLISTAFLLGETYNPFLYFRF